MLTKGAKAHQGKVGSARLIVYTAHLIRAGLDFQDRVPVLSVPGLPLDMVRARVKFWSGTDGAKSFTRLNLSVPNQFFWYAYFFHPSRAKNFRPCKWGLSFIDLYLVFPWNFRMVFLPNTNTVILLEPYCGTIKEPGLPVILSHMALKCDKRFEISAVFGRWKSLQNVGTSGYFLACIIFRTSFFWREIHVWKISTYIPKIFEYSWPCCGSLNTLWWED